MLLSSKTKHTSKDNVKPSIKYNIASAYQKQSKSRDTIQERRNSEFIDVSNSLRAIDTGDIGTFRKNPKLAMPLQQTIGNRGVQRLLLPLQESQHRPMMSSPSDIVHGKSGIGNNSNNSTSNTEQQKRVAGRGKSLDPGDLKYMGGKFGHDFSDVNVHTDKPASETARSMHADAFTIGREIYFAQGKYNPSTREGKRLLAHELTHVIQQSKSPMRPSSPQLSPTDGPSGTDQAEMEAEMEAEISAENVVAEEGATKAGIGAEETTQLKTVVDLQGITNFQQVTDFKAIDEFITQQDKTKGMINVRFGTLAEGQMEIKKNKKSKEYRGKALIPLTRHPLLPIPALTESGPSLYLEVAKNSEIQGQVSFGKQNFSALVKRNNPDVLRLLGLQELDLKGVSVKNSIETGNLSFGLENFSFSLGSLLSGSGTIIALNDKITFQASADVNVRGLDKGHMNFERDSASGAIKGRADLAVTLQEGKFSGNVTANYDAGIITGEGKIGYKSEKFSGQVTLRLSDENEAATSTSAEKMAPPAKGQPKTRESKKKPNYVVSGDGVLDFAFNEWLTGSANVIVDPSGYLTVIGKITPAAEVILFEEKNFRKELAKLEARAAYGIPVIGNIFVAAGVELILWGKIGPGKLYKIEVGGEYSTDPKARQNYSIQASLNISAAAGATLRGEGKAGIEILAHDIAIGVGVNGTLGVKGYVEATPVIGYREEGEGDQDKKGVYFISGDIEIAAMPFFSLSGDIFIELDSPWVSPLPDKTWKWDLGEKEWPLGGSFGIRASVEHIVGSGQWPSIEFQEVDFSPEKFLTDLVEEKAAPSGQALAEQAGKWKEKNTKDAPVPEAVSALKAGAQEGGPPAQPPAKTPPLPTPKRKKEKKPGPSELAPKGETKQEQEVSFNALEKQKRELEKAVQKKGPRTGKEKAEQEKFDKEKQDEREKEKKEKWEKGVAVIDQALTYAEETGISEDELMPILKSIRRQKQYGFKELYARDEEGKYAIYGSMSPADKIKEIPKVEEPARIKLPPPAKAIQLLGVPAQKAQHRQEIEDAIERWRRTTGKDITLITQSPHEHHLLPQALRPEFAKIPIDIELSEYKVKLDPIIHLAHVHGGGWNRTWKEFFDNNKKPTVEDVNKKLAEMIKSWDIAKYVKKKTAAMLKI